MTTQSKTIYKLRVPDPVKDLVRGLHPQVKKKVRSALKLILTEPNIGKLLKQDLKGLQSYKIGRLRIVYRIASKQVIEIVAIGPRNKIYEETYLIVKKESEPRP